MKDGTTDTNQIRSWWQSHPNANVAIATGRPSGIVVVDVDVKNGARGDESLRRLNGFDVTSITLRASTPSGGFHIVYALPPGVDIGNSAGSIGPGIDVRGTGGYIAAEPSVTTTGGYQWSCQFEEIPLQLPPLPECFMPQTAILAASPKFTIPSLPPKIAQIVEERLMGIARAPVGRRNATLNGNVLYLCRFVRNRQIDLGFLVDSAFEASQRAGCSPKEAIATIDSALKRGLR